MVNRKAGDDNVKACIFFIKWMANKVYPIGLSVIDFNEMTLVPVQPELRGIEHARREVGEYGRHVSVGIGIEQGMAQDAVAATQIEQVSGLRARRAAQSHDDVDLLGRQGYGSANAIQIGVRQPGGLPDSILPVGQLATPADACSRLS